MGLSVGLAVVFAAVLVVYLTLGDEPLRWVEMAYRLFYVRISMRSFERRGSTIPDEFERRVDTSPHQSALHFMGEELSFLELDRMANRVASWALSKGLRKGDVVGLMMGNCPEFIATWLGLSKIGVVSALVNTKLTGKSLEHCFNITNPKIIIADVKCAPHARPATAALHVPVHVYSRRISNSNNNGADGKTERRDVDLNVDNGRAAGRGGGLDQSPSSVLRTSLDAELKGHGQTRVARKAREGVASTSLLFYIFTSGTTGMPKAARITHARFFAAGVAFGFMNRIKASDRIYCCLPLYHSAGGMIGVSISWWSGATLIISRKFSARKFFSECLNSRATVVQYIGQICRYLLSVKPGSSDRDHNVTKAIGNGMQLDTWLKFQQRFGIPYIGEFYAATEGNAVMINNQNKEGAVGYVPPIADSIPCVNYPLKLIKIDIDTGSPLRTAPPTGSKKDDDDDNRHGLAHGPCVVSAVGEPGELISRITTSSIDRRFDGYLDRAATQKKILRDVFRKGDTWFRTGDLLRRDHQGYYFFVDRLGDTFRWCGENVATTEVEKCINSSENPK
uniref:AMP-dependent synthetase/ligase domain-containing protein n=1 Tax=Lotharella globosa TaxID=91324 RepID=A0A6V3KGP3_9EUKA